MRRSAKRLASEIAEFGLIKEKLAEMAIRVFALESMVYRSAGEMELAMAAASGSSDKTQNTMKVLEEYAIESSIAKVYGTEVLDYVVDEAVQIFGGYGFHEDYPVSRAYRDSRVNRIFEGTNEINRLLIIQMLLKRAMGGQLALIPAAMKLADEVLAGPSTDGIPGRRFFAALKKPLWWPMPRRYFCKLLAARCKRFREKLTEEQELGGGACQYRDGNLCDGVLFSANAKSRGHERRSFRAGNDQCNACVRARRSGPH